ncbi:MAG TPA: hypothetical protein VKZ79_00040 [Alphaproteobacteria bacterium]|nr:hypothetical protein [Alphaproteobacteria bacterium]
MSDKISDDLLEGADAIASELGWPRRRVYYTIESGSGWPIWREGGVITSTRSALKNHLAARAKEAVDRARLPSAEAPNGAGP